jgi:MFS family permease
VTSDRSIVPPGAWSQLGILSLVQLLGMTLWFSATAVTPALSRELGMTRAEAAWLTMAVQGGFVAGTLTIAILNLADRISARHLVCMGALGGAAANVAVLVAPSSWIAIGLRLLTGVALAAIYPPAMKIAASWFRFGRGFALGLLIAALTLGKAVPYLITTLFGDNWRLPLVIASVLAFAAALIVITLVRNGPYLADTAPFDPYAIRRILANRGARLAILGYLGHMWELYAMWTWIGAFAAASFLAAGLGARSTAAGSLAAFLAIGSGAAGCALAGYVADRLGKARVARWALIGSAACCLLTIAVYGRAPALTFFLVMAWGFVVVADSAQFSALVSEHAPANHVGTALTLQTSLGFLLTMVTIDGLPRVASAVGWQYAAVLLVPGPVLGAVAMRQLERSERSSE